MNTSAFVAIVANPYISPPDSFLINSSIADKAVDVAIGNKIFPLFYDRCVQLSIRLSDESEAVAEEYMRRRAEQLKEMMMVTNLCHEFGIEFAFFKTFRPFTYIPDDVDIITKNEADFRRLIHALYDNGYRLLMVGTPAIILRKVTNRTHVDLDIHRAIAVGYLQLFESSSIWDNIIYRDIGNGFKVPVLSEDYEVITMAAHSLFKDFSLNIPTLYLATYCLLRRRVRRLEELAQKACLALPLNMLLFTALQINRIFYGKEIGSSGEVPFDEIFLTDVISADLNQGFTMPYQYPLLLPIYVYAWRTWCAIKKHNVKTLTQLGRQPFSKGIGLLINYFKLLKGKKFFP